MQEDLSKIAIRQSYLSIVLNTLLFCAKFCVGLTTGSIALMADAWHTISDSLSSIIILISIKISSNPADDDHPFGHGRVEILGSVILGLLLFIVAYEFTKESIIKLINQDELIYGKLALLVTMFSIMVKELLAQYAFYVGRKTKYLSVIADGWHHRSDAVSSLIILVGIFFNRYIVTVDSYLGLIVALFIAATAYKIIRKNISVLIGEAPAQELIEEITKIAKRSAKLDLHLHHFHLHTYGQHQELTFHIKLPEKMILKEAHALATKIEREIKAQLTIEATIHTET